MNIMIRLLGRIWLNCSLWRDKGYKSVKNFDWVRKEKALEKTSEGWLFDKLGNQRDGVKSSKETLRMEFQSTKV